jgi:alkylhydroperoxidase family enzyme
MTSARSSSSSPNQEDLQISRMTAPVEADIPAASRSALDTVARQLGFVPNTHGALAVGPKALNALLDFKKAMVTTVDAATRQGIALAVTEVNGCNYCDAMHTWVSQNLTHLDADEIARNRAGSSTDARRAAALAFAREVALTCGMVADGALVAAPSDSANRLS